MLKLYNTMTRKKETFKPIKGKNARMYTCGPTVYNYAHIGNFRSYLFSDLLRRYLEYRDFKVKLVMNITDVDDKTIRDSRKEGTPIKDFTEKYTKIFLNDLKSLRIKDADIYPKARDHIKEMIKLIKILVKKGFAYKSDDGSIYFSISKFKKYGKLSNLNISSLKSGARINNDEYAKDEARDFALWKAYTEEDGDVFWDTGIEKGRPGWHIECSVMSTKYLGQPFDIHTGGIDLMFPHHENEIAQSTSFNKKNLANFWLHGEHLMVDGRKMAKSAGNFYTLEDLRQKGLDLLSFRYLCLSNHYRSQMNFTFSSLESAKNTTDKINEFNLKIKNVKISKIINKKILVFVKKSRQNFEKSMDNDLDTVTAFAYFFEFMNYVNKNYDKIDKKSLKEIKEFMSDFNYIFDVIEEKTIDKKDEKLIKEREEARKKKDFKKADEIREKLKKKGIIVEDTPNGPIWR